MDLNVIALQGTKDCQKQLNINGIELEFTFGLQFKVDCMSEHYIRKKNIIKDVVFIKNVFIYGFGKYIFSAKCKLKLC